MRNETTNLPLLKDLDEIKARMAEVDAMYDAARYQIRMSLDVMDPVDREATLDQHPVLLVASARSICARSGPTCGERKNHERRTRRNRRPGSS